MSAAKFTHDIQWVGEDGIEEEKGKVRNRNNVSHPKNSAERDYESNKDTPKQDIADAI